MMHRIGSGSLVSSQHTIGQGGFGTLAQNIPSSGTHGPAILYPFLVFPRDNDKEVRVEVVTWPTQGDLFVHPDSSFKFTGAPAGNYFFEVQVYENGTTVDAPIRIDLIISVTGELTVNYSFAWALRVALSLSKATNWDMTVFLNVAYTYGWDVLAALAEVIKTQQINWSMVQHLQKSPQLYWDLRELLSQSSTMDWQLVEPAAATKTTRWSASALVSSTKQASWDMRQATSLPSALTANWHLRGSVNASVQMDWDVLSALLSVTRQLSVQWNADQVLSALKSTQWDSRIETTSQSDIDWALRTLLATSKSMEWDARTATVRLQDVHWSMTASIYKAVMSNWQVLEGLGVTKDMVWRLSEGVANTLIMQWQVGVESVTKQIDLRWDSISVVDNQIVLNWVLATEVFELPLNAIIVLGTDPIIEIVTK